MPDERAFTFSFELPESVPTAEQDEAKEWLDDFAARLARKDQLLVEIGVAITTRGARTTPPGRGPGRTRRSRVTRSSASWCVPASVPTPRRSDLTRRAAVGE